MVSIKNSHIWERDLMAVLENRELTIGDDVWVGGYVCNYVLNQTSFTLVIETCEMGCLVEIEYSILHGENKEIMDLFEQFRAIHYDGSVSFVALQDYCMVNVKFKYSYITNSYFACELGSPVGIETFTQQELSSCEFEEIMRKNYREMNKEEQKNVNSKK